MGVSSCGRDLSHSAQVELLEDEARSAQAGKIRKTSVIGSSLQLFTTIALMSNFPSPPVAAWPVSHTYHTHTQTLSLSLSLSLLNAEASAWSWPCCRSPPFFGTSRLAFFVLLYPVEE